MLSKTGRRNSEPRRAIIRMMSVLLKLLIQVMGFREKIGKIFSSLAIAQKREDGV